MGSEKCQLLFEKVFKCDIFFLLKKVYKPEERMSVRQALAHPWLQVLKQPGIEISEQYQISTERLRNYYVGLK